MTTAATPAAKAPAEARQTALNKAYAAANGALRDNHRAEFEALYVKEARARGQKYEPKKTAEQKAVEEFVSLIEKYPEAIKARAESLFGGPTGEDPTTAEPGPSPTP